jgi:hypothetical protein
MVMLKFCKNIWEFDNLNFSTQKKGFRGDLKLLYIIIIIIIVLETWPIFWLIWI